MLKVKTNVTPKNLVIAAAVANVAEVMGLTLVITSGTDGVHMPKSKHYTGEALDIRISNLGNSVGAVVQSLRDRLGHGYDIVLEKDHIHIESDPK